MHSSPRHKCPRRQAATALAGPPRVTTNRHHHKSVGTTSQPVAPSTYTRGHNRQTRNRNRPCDTHHIPTEFSYQHEGGPGMTERRRWVGRVGTVLTLHHQLCGMPNAVCQRDGVLRGNATSNWSVQRPTDFGSAGSRCRGTRRPKPARRVHTAVQWCPAALHCRSGDSVESHRTVVYTKLKRV